MVAACDRIRSARVPVRSARYDAEKASSRHLVVRPRERVFREDIVADRCNSFSDRYGLRQLPIVLREEQCQIRLGLRNARPGKVLCEPIVVFGLSRVALLLVQVSDARRQVECGCTLQLLHVDHQRTVAIASCSFHVALTNHRKWIVWKGEHCPDDPIIPRIVAPKVPGAPGDLERLPKSVL
jgi:hypothetical protein